MIGRSVEGDCGVGAGGLDGRDGKPGLRVVRNDNGHAVALAGEVSLELTALKRERFLNGNGINLDERLLYADDSHVDKFDSAAVGLSRALDGEDVAGLYSKAEEILLGAAGVKCSIDISLARTVIDVHVAISGVHNFGDGTLDAVGFAVLAVLIELLAGSDREIDLFGHLQHIDDLGLAVTGQVKHSLVCRGGGVGLEADGGLTGGTGGR